MKLDHVVLHLQLSAMRRLRQCISIGAMVIAIFTVAHATTPKTTPDSCRLSAVDAARFNEDESTDVKALSDFQQAAYDLMKRGKFAQLDCVATSVRTKKEKFAGGMWKIHAVYWDLGKPPLHPTEEDWRVHMALVKKWVALRPQSVTARITLAKSYVEWAQDARGTGFADTVSPSGWKLHDQRLAKAKLTLEKASALPAKDPEWFVIMQEVALGTLDPEANRDLFARAVKFEPDYYYYYQHYAQSILPKWGGEEGETEKFAQESADQAGGDAGDALYFRIASNLLICNCQDPPKLSWARIQRGFAATEKLYGPSHLMWNYFAHMAVNFGDQEVAEKMFARMGDQWDKDTWQTSENYDAARKWAAQVSVRAGQRQTAEEAVAANLRSPQGQQYQAIFAEKLLSLAQSCLEGQSASDISPVELLMKLGKDGTIEDIKGGGSPSVMSHCLGKKLYEFQQNNETAFPPPPQASYWVRYDFGPESVPTATLK